MRRFLVGLCLLGSLLSGAADAKKSQGQVIRETVDRVVMHRTDGAMGPDAYQVFKFKGPRGGNRFAAHTAAYGPGPRVMVTGSFSGKGAATKVRVKDVFLNGRLTNLRDPSCKTPSCMH